MGAFFTMLTNRSHSISEGAAEELASVLSLLLAATTGLFSTAAPSHGLWLTIKAKRHDQFAALFVDLEGTLDRLNAHELLKRISEAAEKARIDIIVNFEHLRHATPEALRALLDGEALKAVLPYAKVRYRKFKAAFENAVQALSIDEPEWLSEDVRDA